MSAPLAGKFIDHYAILGVDPGADSDTIQIAYSKLHEKYGADNAETADPAKLTMIQGAYETLSNPELRKEFDAIKGVTRNSGRAMFMGMEFFDVLGREVGLRGALLSVLYDRRRSKPFTPSLSMRQLESILEASVEAMNFALWYLKQRGFVGSDDKSSLQITVAGMDFLENNRPKPEDVMPFIKLSAILGTAGPDAADPSKTEAPKKEAASVEAAMPQATTEPAAASEANTAEAIQPDADRAEPQPTRQEAQPQLLATRAGEPQRAPRPKLDGASVRSMLNRTQSTR